jgi:hypothetical protein
LINFFPILLRTLMKIGGFEEKVKEFFHERNGIIFIIILIGLGMMAYYGVE